MNLIYNFHFKLINAILDNIRCHTKDSNIISKIEFVSKGGGFNPVTIYDKIIESDIIELVDLITPRIGVYGEEFKCSINGKSM